MRAHAASQFGVVTGSSQAIEQPIGAKTTNATPTEMGLNNAGTLIRFNILADTQIDAMVSVNGVKSDGSASARYRRQVTIKRVGNTTSLVGSVITLGTDEAAGTAISITADDANDSLKIEVTGIAAETWRWSGLVVGTEMFIGTSWQHRQFNFAARQVRRLRCGYSLPGPILRSHRQRRRKRQTAKGLTPQHLPTFQQRSISILRPSAPVR
jgi:hypothetical protein